jgi:predicted house-cleaning noncanonical NTP pyrophosphatase (MazG superfamily)
VIIENSKMKNRKHKEDIDFRRALLDKHSQLMRMYLRHNNVEQAKTQFEIIKPIFSFLNNEGETMEYYTLENFERDSKQFEK